MRRIGGRVRLTRIHPRIRLVLLLALVLVLGAIARVLVVSRGAATAGSSAPRTAIASSRWGQGRVALNDRDLPRASGG